jgi:protein SCO1
MSYYNQYLTLVDRRDVMTLIIFIALFFAPLPLIAQETTPDFTCSIGDYNVPDVEVVNQDGKKLSFINELDNDRPVMLNFVFTSCSAICPMLSHIFSNVQAKLEKNNQKVHLVSISIDPENDTPAKLSEYAKKFGAKSQWDYYTGTMETSIAIQKAFDAYRGDKMNHSSVILMRAKFGKSWLRIEGFASPDTIIREYGNIDNRKNSCKIGQ